jgi:hypothetical protein
MSKCTLTARVFEDEVSILRSAKLYLLVHTDEIGSAGAAMSPRDRVWSAAISPKSGKNDHYIELMGLDTFTGAERMAGSEELQPN